MANVVAKSVTGLVSRIVGFLRGGYPEGMPATGYLPLVALLPRRVSDDEVAVITELMMDKDGSIDAADLGVEISRITNEMPSPDDVERVRERLAANGRSAGHEG